MTTPLDPNEAIRILQEVVEKVLEELGEEGCEQSSREDPFLLLDRHLGALPDPTLARIYRADLADLEHWLAHAITEILDAVFDRTARNPTGAEQRHEEGRLRGLRENLILLQTRRFGALTERLFPRIHSAALAELQRWFDRSITASSLDAVFAGEP